MIKFSTFIVIQDKIILINMKMIDYKKYVSKITRYEIIGKKFLLGKTLKFHISLCNVYPNINKDLSINILHVITLNIKVATIVRNVF